MSDIFDDRRRGLEEEYFHKKNQEAIDKLRDKIAISSAAKAAGNSSMTCPRCHNSLKTINFEEVEIDTCAKCAGVWLDSAEFEKLTKQKLGWFGRLLHSWNSE